MSSLTHLSKIANDADRALSQDLQAEWLRLQAAIRNGEVMPGQESSKASSLLERCRKAGRVVGESEARASLYMLAKEIGAKLEAVSGTYPQTALEAVDPPTQMPMGSQGIEGRSMYENPVYGVPQIVTQPTEVAALSRQEMEKQSVSELISRALNVRILGPFWPFVRRRWLIVFPLAAIVALSAFTVGWKVMPTYYVSTALLSTTSNPKLDSRDNRVDVAPPPLISDRKLLEVIAKETDLETVPFLAGRKRSQSELLQEHVSIVPRNPGYAEVVVRAESSEGVKELANATAKAVVSLSATVATSELTKTIDALNGAFKARAKSIGQKTIELRNSGLTNGTAITSPEDAINAAELDASRAEYRSIRDKLSQLALQTLLVGARPPVWVSSEADAPQHKGGNARAKSATTLAGSAFLGIILAAWMFDSRRRVVSTAFDIREDVGIRVLGTLPPASLKTLITSQATAVMMAEAIDYVRATILYESSSPRQVVLVTSAAPIQGNTTVAANLALSLSRAGRRTLLIDGNLRVPSVHKLFGSTLEDGLSEVLRSEIDLVDAVKPTSNDGLYLLTAGVCSAEAIHAMATDQPQAMFEKLRDQFDFVIIDSSPVLNFSDSLSLGQFVDGAILSVLRDHTEVQLARQAVVALRQVGVKLIGAVVNGVPLNPDRRVVLDSLAVHRERLTKS